MKHTISRNIQHHKNNIETYCVISWAIILCIYLVSLFSNWGYDDPYITYRYAENISRNAGFVYNHGEKVLGTTTPFYTLLLAFFNTLGFDIPLTSNVLSCLSLVAGGIACWLLGRRWNTPIIGIVGLLIYPTFPLLATTIGSEMAFYNMVILFGLVAYAYDKMVFAALLLVIAILTRYDGIVAAGWIVLYDSIRYRRIRVWHLLLASGLLMIWVGWAWLYFGSPLPNTLAAKQQQGAMLGSMSFLSRAMMLLQTYLGLGWFYVHVSLAIIGGVVLITRRSPWLIIFVWNILYFLGYTVLQVNAYFWYYAPLIVGLSCLVGAGTDALYRLFQRYWKIQFVNTLLCLIIGTLIITNMRYLSRPQRDKRLDTYTAVGSWIKTHTPESARVGALEIGIIGYYADRPMLDFAGLIQPDVAQHIGTEAGYDEAAMWAVRSYQPEYLVLTRGVLPKTEQLAQIQCSMQTQFSLPPNGSVDIYLCHY